MFIGVTPPTNITNDEMNAPYFVAASTSVGGSSITSHVITLPTGSLAGDTVTVYCTLSAQVVCTFPTGWGAPQNTNFAIAQKTIDGSEGASITITTASGVIMNYLATTVRNSLAGAGGIAGSFLVGSSGTASTAPDTTSVSNASPQMCMSERLIVAGSVSGFPYANNHFTVAVGSTIGAMMYCTSDPFWFQDSYTGPSWTGVSLGGSANWVSERARNRTTF